MDNKNEDIEILTFGDDEQNNEVIINTANDNVVDNEVVEPVELVNNPDKFASDINIDTDVDSVKLSNPITNTEVVNANTSINSNENNINQVRSSEVSRVELPTDAFGYGRAKTTNKPQNKNGNGFIIVVLVLVLLAGGVFYYFNNVNNKKDVETNYEEKDDTVVDDKDKDKEDTVVDDKDKEDSKEKDETSSQSDLKDKKAITSDKDLSMEYVKPDQNNIGVSSKYVASMFVYYSHLGIINGGRVSEMGNINLVNMTVLYLKLNNVCYSKDYLNSKAMELFGVELKTTDLPEGIIFGDNKYCVGANWGVGGNTSPLELTNSSNHQEGEKTIYEYEYSYEVSKTIVRLEYLFVNDHYVLENVVKTVK